MKLSDKQAKVFAAVGILVLAKYADIIAPDKFYYIVWGVMTAGLIVLPGKKNKGGEK